MVTDEKYKNLEKRVAELERKLELLSRQYSSLLMKNDMRTFVTQSSTSKVRRDTTKYLFNHNVYCKRDLVLACVKKYVETYPNINGEQLIDVFPNYIQGSLGIVRPFIEAEKYSSADKRFFFSDKDVLRLNDDTYVVCSQWDKKNIGRFIMLVRDLGYNIEEKKRKF